MSTSDDAFIEHCKQKGWNWTHTGFPDFIVETENDGLLFIEVKKRFSDKLRENQLNTMDILSRHGLRCFVGLESNNFGLIPFRDYTSMNFSPIEDGKKLLALPRHCLSVDPNVYITTTNIMKIHIDLWHTGVTLSEAGLKIINQTINENGWSKRLITKSQINISCKKSDQNKYLKIIFSQLNKRKTFNIPSNKEMIESVIGPLFKRGSK